MEIRSKRNVRRGEIYCYDFGKNKGSIQGGVRPVVVIQCNEGNNASTTTVVAAITSATKRTFLPSHIILGENYGLTVPSMVLLEQLSTVNQNDLYKYIGYIDDEKVMRAINNGVKKALGLWNFYPQPESQVRCLCGKCLGDYLSNPNYIVRRHNPYDRKKEQCDKCKFVELRYEKHFILQLCSKNRL